MNPLALFLLVLAVGFGVGALIIFALTGGGLNVFWLLGIFAVIAALAVQTFWPATYRRAPRAASRYFDEAQAISRLDRLDGVASRKADR